MADFQIGDVKEVREVLGEGKVTRHIKSGWKLLNTAAGKDEAGYPLIKYALGWFDEEAPLPEHQY